jgi:hypothetical protein
MRFLRRRPRVTEVQRIRLRPGDVVLYTMPDSATYTHKDAVESIVSALCELFPRHKVMVVSAGTTLRIVEPGDNA